MNKYLLLVTIYDVCTGKQIEQLNLIFEDENDEYESAAALEKNIHENLKEFAEFIESIRTKKAKEYAQVFCEVFPFFDKSDFDNVEDTEDEDDEEDESLDEYEETPNYVINDRG